MTAKADLTRRYCSAILNEIHQLQTNFACSRSLPIIYSLATKDPHSLHFHGALGTGLSNYSSHNPHRDRRRHYNNFAEIRIAFRINLVRLRTRLTVYASDRLFYSLNLFLLL